MLIDSHCHVLSSEYDNIDEIISNCRKNKIEKLIVNGYDIKSSIEAVDLASKYDIVYAAVGIGPEDVLNIKTEDILKIESLVKSKKVVAIGEIGLDYYWTNKTKDEQLLAFNKLLKIAEDNNLPVIVHSREATKDVLDTLKKYNVTGIIHCFNGSYETAKEFINLGFLIGIGGVVTFKNSKTIKDVVSKIDLESISLETDSPYLSPEPFRGHKNEPSNVFYVAKKISEIKNVDLEYVIEKTGNNVFSKFDLN